MLQMNLLRRHFCRKKELVDSPEKSVPICQARLLHIPDACNITAAVSRNFTNMYIFSVKHLQHAVRIPCTAINSHMCAKICIKRATKCLLCPLHPSDFPLVPETKVRKNRIGGMIKCGHVNTKYWFGRGSCMWLSVCVCVCVCVSTSRACLTNPSLELLLNRIKTYLVGTAEDGFVQDGSRYCFLNNRTAR